MSKTEEISHPYNDLELEIKKEIVRLLQDGHTSTEILYKFYDLVWNNITVLEKEVKGSNKDGILFNEISER